jgi:hypothetical protein
MTKRSQCGERGRVKEEIKQGEYKNEYRIFKPDEIRGSNQFGI